MEGKSGVTRSIIDELHSSVIQRDLMKCERGVTRSVVDEHHSRDIQGDQMEDEGVVLQAVSLMNFVLEISKEIKWKMTVLLLEV